MLSESSGFDTAYPDGKPDGFLALSGLSGFYPVFGLSVNQ
jgi:hypothetical protein